MSLRTKPTEVYRKCLLIGLVLYSSIGLGGVRDYSLCHQLLMSWGLRTEPLTKKEQSNIFRYTWHDAYKINSAMREGQHHVYAKQIKSIRRALKKLPVYQGKVYRAIGTKRSAIKDYDKLGQSFKEGEIFSDDGFLSCSKSRQMPLHAANGGIHNYGWVWKSAKALRENELVFFTIESKTGRRIWDYSDNKGEKEVLFLDRVEFLITEVKQGKYGEYYVTMVEQ